MKIGLFGFGKTGRAVASVLLQEQELDLQWVIRRSQQADTQTVAEQLSIGSAHPARIYAQDTLSFIDLLQQQPVDVIIDFSSEHGIDTYGEIAAKRGIAIISAISHYSEEKIAYLKKLAQHTVVMHSPNITLGVNFLMMAAKILQKIAPATDIEIIEEHFKDKPEISGTAKVIADGLDLPQDNIKTVRAGGIIGVHEILFGFPYQTVRLKHESIAREAFGTGILFALKNIRDKHNGFYDMESLLKPYFQAAA
ncbi:MAG: dihydrodipicolinate reductase C-terminal domain-containing protein [Neisseria sp.]|nr:dihydrodipicolinate reductase C-terminal domain-containing protein [Neisseria sp.]